MKGDIEVAMATMKHSGYSIEGLDECETVKDVMLAAMKVAGMAALRLAPKELKGDKEVVMSAVAQNGRALHLASTKL